MSIKKWFVQFSMLFDSMEFGTTEGGYFRVVSTDNENKVWDLADKMEKSFTYKYARCKGARGHRTIISSVDGDKLTMMHNSDICAPKTFIQGEVDSLKRIIDLVSECLIEYKNDEDENDENDEDENDEEEDDEDDEDEENVTACIEAFIALCASSNANAHAGADAAFRPGWDISSSNIGPPS